MLDWLFIMLLVLTIILTLMSIEFDLGIFWNITFITISMILWLLLAASIQEIEIPYQMYNATSGNIETGYHIFSSPISPYLMYLFFMFAAIMLIYFVGYILGPAIMKKWMR